MTGRQDHTKSRLAPHHADVGLGWPRGSLLDTSVQAELERIFGWHKL